MVANIFRIVSARAVWGLVMASYVMVGPLPAATPTAGLTMVVMDPLAKPLSCPCVKGYAQRDYLPLAKHLEMKLEMPVQIVFHESLITAASKQTQGRVDVVVGKRSVIVHDLQQLKLQGRSVARLTGKDGSTTMTGLVVVPGDDPAQTIADLRDYRLVLGPAECDEKYGAALTLFQANQVAVPAKPETSVACSDGALAILEHAEAGLHGAAVISSYAKPLLEGCGTIEKGALRVVGETEPVPFIEAFVTDQLSAEQQQRVMEVLLAVAQEEPAMRTLLESRDGFIAAATEVPLVKKNDR